ncbi:hypothetical protein HF521_021346 [Silurus meridionalis]|uniref:HEAT repeat-containing protein 4 n=1 Tax=Silurus meridionalis TaxID=175797 RepID=A0A8T0BB24_SILME|nr:hypothetical protein HF521_021346 [Silurus meridionalis]
MEQCLSRRREKLFRQLVSDASKGLTFSQDVMWEMGLDNISYSEADFSWLFCASGPWAPNIRSKSRKHGGMKVLQHHAGLRSSVTSPLPAFPPLQTVHQHSLTNNDLFITVPGPQDGKVDSVKRTGQRGVLNVNSQYQLPTILEEEEQSRASKGNESVLKKLTKNTVKWTVRQKISRDCQYQSRLKSMMNNDQYWSASAANLVTEESKVEEDLCGFGCLPKSSTTPRALQRSKTETPLPVYYRQDILKPHAGKYVYNTENCFELELYSGIGKQVHQPGRTNQDRIIMDNNSEYQKKLQKRVPCGPEMWTDLPSADMQSVTKGWCLFLCKSTIDIYIFYEKLKVKRMLHTFLPAEISRLEKGVQQWVVLPTKANYATEQGLRPPDYTRQEAKVAKEPVHYSPLQRLSSLRYAVEGWKNAWKIKTSRQSVTIEGLMKDLTDLHSQVRVAAIVTCASRAVNRPKLCPHSDETGLAQHGQSYEVEAVPPELQPLLLLALNDPVKRVQLAAAVCQYAIGTPNAQARDILQKALQQDSSGTGVDGWVAAQCLAIEGEASQSVIERLLSQLFLSNAPSDQEQADTLLVSISSKTILVRSLLGEELNCADWKKRVLACKTISELKCPINKDLTNKLLYLMWNDWNGLVRQAAVEALGKMGLGSAIHNELSAKLHEGPTSWRVQALILIGQLKIMTAKLLASFLRCLTDEFVVVRKQACSTAASLMIKDEMIQKNLLHLMQNDSSCEVKVAAINALGRIGWLTPTLQRLLLWAVQNEEDPSVRIVACEALKTLGVKCPELQNLLQERLILETNAQVHRHIEDLMKHYGYSQDTSMFHMITEQVQKLCTKRNITEKLLLLEDLKQQTIENGSHI